MSLKQWFKKKFKKSPAKMTDEEWQRKIDEVLARVEIDTTMPDENSDDVYNLIQYCPYCGDVDTREFGDLCVYCKHRLVKVPKEQMTHYGLVKEINAESERIYQETGKYPMEVPNWQDLVTERLKIEENPQFNPSLRNLRLYKQKKLSDPCVECPVCGSMNTYFLDPERKTEYTGLFGGTNSNYGKTFGCVTCGHKW